MSANSHQYVIQQEPYYQPQEDEIELYEAAYAERLPVMIKGPRVAGGLLSNLVFSPLIQAAA